MKFPKKSSAIELLILLSIIFYFLFWNTNIWDANEHKITISPAVINFNINNVSELHSLLVHNESKNSIDNVWIKLEPKYLDDINILIKARPRDDAEFFEIQGGSHQGKTLRSDTFILKVKDESGNISILVGIKKLNPNDAYEYIIALHDDIGVSDYSLLEASVLKESKSNHKTQAIIKFQKDGLAFPISPPIYGEIVSVGYFGNNR